MEKELINQEEAVVPTILDLLLGKNVVAVNKQLPTAQYEVPRLSAAAGKPVLFTLRALPYGRVQEMKRLTDESAIQILLAGCVEPDLKDVEGFEAFIERYKAGLPIERAAIDSMKL